EEKIVKLTFISLFIQSIATSIDALSVGFTFADYVVSDAIICSSIIMVVTALISFAAVIIGKKFGDALGKKAEILGGIILILIGIEIFITGII
ncbi:MAG: manganese efflux pump, partial [Bacillales bacterium]|nr:manganese efflux pump [Bacillales bacterium]